MPDRPLEPVIGLAEGEARWRTMTTEHEFAFSRRGAPKLCWDISLPPVVGGRREDRVRAAPAVSRAKCINKSAHEHTGSAEAVRPSLRSGSTAYFELSPAIGLFCHRHRREISPPA